MLVTFGPPGTSGFPARRSVQKRRHQLLSWVGGEEFYQPRSQGRRNREPTILNAGIAESGQHVVHRGYFLVSGNRGRIKAESRPIHEGVQTLRADSGGGS